MRAGGKTTGQPSLPLDPVLSEKQILDWLGIASATASRWRAIGEGPAYVQLGPRRIGYRRSVVETWLLGRERKSADQSS
jgi:predicted DNA-binding transcriptional regulator AlpA